jgi:hypothetical protein
VNVISIIIVEVISVIVVEMNTLIAIGDKIDILDILRGILEDIMMIIVGEMQIFINKIGHNTKFIALLKMKIQEQEEKEDLLGEEIIFNIKNLTLKVIIPILLFRIFEEKHRNFPLKNHLKFMLRDILRVKM